MKRISRLSFIGGLSTLSLAACSSGSGGFNNVLTSADPNAQLYATMRRVGVAGFTGSKGTVILPEYAGKNLFPAQGKSVDCGEPLIGKGHAPGSDACGTTGGGSTLPVIATVSCSAGWSVTIGASAYDDVDVDVQGTYIPNLSGPPQVGPMYGLTSPLPTNCTGEALAAVGTTILGIATWVQNNAAAYGLAKNLVEEAGWVIAGEITLAEFAALAIATLSAPELLAALFIIGASAAAIGTIVMYIKCETGH